MSSIPFLLFIWLCLFRNGQTQMNATKMTKILKHLLTGYDKDIPPVENDLPVNIKVQLIFSDMFPFQAVDMHYSADFYIKMIWFDYRLAYNISDNATVIPFRGNKLWKPDIFFPMAKRGSLHSVPEANEGSSLFLNGTVSHSQRINLMSYCHMELIYYPFDIQDCNFTITTFVDNKDYVNLHWHENAIIKNRGEKIDMKDFNIVKSEKTQITSSEGREGVFDVLVLKFQFYRYLAFYFLRDFFPCILIVILSWITFWIDFSSTPARVGMGITTVLTIVTMTNSIRNGAPPAGLFRSLDWYLLMCNLFVFAALGEYAIVGLTSRVRKAKPGNKTSYNVGNEETNNGPREFNREIMMMKTHSNGEDPEVKVQEFERRSESQPIGNKRLVKSCHYIDRMSRFLFPGSFIAFNIIYFVYHRLNKHTVD